MAPKPEPDRLLFVFGMRDLIGMPGRDNENERDVT
jgi:hypothetical protein